MVTGVPTRRFDVTIRGPGWVHGVKFRPGGLSSLTGVHGRRPARPHAAASEVCRAAPPPRCAALGPDVRPTTAPRPSTPAGGAGSEPEPDYDALLEVVGPMLGDRSMVRVAQVEERCGLGTRSLQRLFARYVGVSPKWVLSRYRMHDVVTALDEGYDGSLADLAAAYGWFDQAHFTREFTALVGVPPGEYRRHP